MTRSIKNSFNLFVAFVLATVFVLFANLPMHAQDMDVKVHFSTEVAVPDHLLAPGDYIFHRINDTDLDTYEIIADDGTPVGIVRAISTRRALPGQNEVDLSAPDGAGVRMVQAWYPTGDTDGFQFSYSDKEQRKLDELARQQANSQGSFAGQP